MNYLLDTHILIWSIVYPDKLSPKVKKIIRNKENTFWVSAITFWEIALKYAIGKLDLEGTTPNQLHEYSSDAGFVILDLTSETAASFYKLTFAKQRKAPLTILKNKQSFSTNKDPFDLMLAWQAISKDFVLVTKDSDLTSYSKYGLKTVW